MFGKDKEENERTLEDVDRRLEEAKREIGELRGLEDDVQEAREDVRDVGTSVQDVGREVSNLERLIEHYRENIDRYHEDAVEQRGLNEEFVRDVFAKDNAKGEWGTAKALIAAGMDPETVIAVTSAATYEQLEAIQEDPGTYLERGVGDTQLLPDSSAGGAGSGGLDDHRDDWQYLVEEGPLTEQMADVMRKKGYDSFLDAGVEGVRDALENNHRLGLPPKSAGQLAEKAADIYKEAL